MNGDQPELSSRARLLLAGGLAVGLALAVVVLTSLGGDGGARPDPPPLEQACLRAWNSDRGQRATGRHQYSAHTYRLVQVVRLRDDATVSDEGGAAGGACAVIFAREALDPEPEAAVEVLLGNRWSALSASPDVTPQRLAALQAGAVEAPNAKLERNGTLAELEG